MNFTRNDQEEQQRPAQCVHFYGKRVANMQHALSRYLKFKEITYRTNCCETLQTEVVKRVQQIKLLTSWGFRRGSEKELKWKKV